VSRKKRELSSDEKQLWRRVAASVKPRRPQPKHVEEEAPTPVRAVKPLAPTPAVKRVAAPRLAPKPEPPLANRGAEKRVRRGKLEIDATLDLHGHTQESGYAALARFQQSAQRREARVVLVVTGVGRTGEGVLRKRLPDWLAARELKPLISGYAQAHRAHGGSGAYYVFLRRGIA